MYNFAIADPSSIGGTAIQVCDEEPPSEMAMTDLAGAVHSVRLRIAEAPLRWEVTIELNDMPAESFEVEVADNEVHILLHDIAPVVLAFPQVIDPSASRGECGDGILRLSLGKQVLRALGSEIL
ncbi:Hsp20/alpha crystallin family protein [Variovorax sp. EBFNA2]|uniref:Hsp20/alpha crystallin family protein n=1 Tax=Variovorax sp. EBFNA2 TaxID=3342097 RepID=UPI0029C0CB69|nr:Hsp20/alpha crystallin family protein [Variovorax boronicumulans]WPG40885.1 Hsp20/alpha crystallin family protein [Variovorax boronicumulans]